MKFKNLFGEMQEFVEKTKKRHTCKDWRRANYYRRDFIPLAGCCKVCVYVIYRRRNSKGYYKCALQGCTNSSASDVRASYVCDLFMGRSGE